MKLETTAEERERWAHLPRGEVEPSLSASSLERLLRDFNTLLSTRRDNASPALDAPGRAPSREEVEAMERLINERANYLESAVAEKQAVAITVDSMRKCCALLRHLSTPSPATQIAVEALWPFAHAAEAYTYPGTPHSDAKKIVVRLGDLRRAAEALSVLLAKIDATAFPTPADTRADASAYEDVHPQYGTKP